MIRAAAGMFISLADQLLAADQGRPDQAVPPPSPTTHDQGSLVRASVVRRREVMVIRDAGRPTGRVLDGLLASAEWLATLEVDMIRRHARVLPTSPRQIRLALEHYLGLWR